MVDYNINVRNKNVARLKEKVGSEENIDIYLMEECQFEGLPLSSEYVNMKKVVVMDCDGVISNGKSYYSKDGKTLKAYGCYDKEMMKLLSKYNWNFVFVSDDKKGIDITKRRIDDLNLEFFNLNSIERYNFIKSLKEEYDIVVFIGDSISDIPSLIVADISGTPNNSPDVVKKFSMFISSFTGGNGAVADILYTIHRLNGKV